MGWLSEMFYTSSCLRCLYISRLSQGLISSVLKSDLATDNRLNFVFRDGRGIRQQFSFCELFSSSPANMRRQDIIRPEKAIDSRVGNVNVLVLR